MVEIVHWDFQVGETATRTELSQRFGGSRYSGGVVPANKSASVLLFSDPMEGVRYGYTYDGASEDGLAFMYTGSGTTGDHREDGPNGAVINHERDGRTLRLFLADGLVDGTNTKYQRYAGAYRLDPAEPFQRKAAPDAHGHTRTVLVFRLLPLSEAVDPVRAGEGIISEVSGEGAASKLVPIEVDSTMFFETSPSEGRIANRAESSLVTTFIRDSGHAESFRRWAIMIPGDHTVLLTDIYDEHDKVLYEAKSASDRVHVRAAVAQLLDYRRHIAVDSVRCVVLLPERPSDDLVDLITSAGFGLTYRHGERFMSLPS